MIEKLLALLPEDVLTDLAAESGVDYNAKKLQGEVVFKLLLYCLLSNKECSLRSMASAYESAIFSLLSAGHHKGTIGHSSISERLASISPDYFHGIYRHCVAAYNKTIAAQDRTRLLRFDSTIVALSSKLLKAGYRLKGGSADHLLQLKFTVGLGDIPQHIDLYSEPCHNSENVALRDSMLSQQQSEGEAGSGLRDIRVFDRGLSSRAAYDALCDSGILFVSRIQPGARHEVSAVYNAATEAGYDSSHLLVSEDVEAWLFGDKGRKSAHKLRIVKTSFRQEPDKKLWFVTNISPEQMNGLEVSEVYRRRWDIEVFFKFIKQHLNFSHLLSRSENGAKVVMYVTMIAAILVMAYRALRAMKGYKLPKQRMAQELEKSLLKIIIKACGGNPDLLQKMMPANSS